MKATICAMQHDPETIRSNNRSADKAMFCVHLHKKP